jgi:hypothetical protein
VLLNALAATLIPPWNGTAALAGVNAADHSAPTSIPHVTITTRIMLLLSRSTVKKPDHRHRRLLRARRKRPRGRRAAGKRDELAPFQLIELHSIPASQRRIAGYRIGEDQSGGNGTILQRANPLNAGEN